MHGIAPVTLPIRRTRSCGTATETAWCARSVARRAAPASSPGLPRASGAGCEEMLPFIGVAADDDHDDAPAPNAQLVGDAMLNDTEHPGRAFRGRRAAEGKRADPNQQRGRSAVQILLSVNRELAPSGGNKGRAPDGDPRRRPRWQACGANGPGYVVQRRRVAFGAEATHDGGMQRSSGRSRRCYPSMPREGTLSTGASMKSLGRTPARMPRAPVHGLPMGSP